MKRKIAPTGKIAATAVLLPKDLSRTVLSIWPIGDQVSAAFTFQHNLKYLTRESGGSVQQGDRESTPKLKPLRTEITLQAHAKNKPKYPVVGWRFGHNPSECDVILDKTHDRGVSGLHFEINHNWNSYAAIITNKSGNALSIRISGQEPVILNCGETTALLSDCYISLEVGVFTYIIEIPDRGDLQQTYEGNLRRYYEKFVRGALPPIELLGIKNAMTNTPAVASHRYIQQNAVGRGVWGRVYRAIEGSTGDQVAIKMFRDQSSAERVQSEIRMLKKLKHVSMSNISECTCG